MQLLFMLSCVCHLPCCRSNTFSPYRNIRRMVPQPSRSKPPPLVVLDRQPRLCGRLTIPRLCCLSWRSIIGCSKQLRIIFK
ncbi:hypothetical protein BDW69DRAFT_167584 [Aspergillus filifer]